jgi:hypothetical protein
MPAMMIPSHAGMIPSHAGHDDSESCRAVDDGEPQQTDCSNLFGNAMMPKIKIF